MFGIFKKFIKKWFLAFLAILCVSYFYAGMENLNGIRSLVMTGLIIAASKTFFNPLLKMLWLPINIITLGIFSWFLEVIHLLIADYLVSNLNFVEFSYEAFKFVGIPFQAGHANMVISVLLGGLFYVFVKKGLEFVSS